jgi:hypothetical protein
VGFHRPRGRLVIPAEFEPGCVLRPDSGCGLTIGSFKEGAAAVYKDGSWRFIDPNGRVAVPGQFWKVGTGFRDGVATVCGRATCGYIDRVGRVIWPWE